MAAHKLRTEQNIDERHNMNASIAADFDTLAPRSFDLRDAMTDVCNGKREPLDVLFAVERHLIVTGNEVPNPFGTSTLAQAFAAISSAAGDARRAGINAAADSREQFRIAFRAERARRERSHDNS